MIVKKKVVKRRKIKRKPGKSKLYFTDDTQASIEKFQVEESEAEKDKIYTNEIMPAFVKLVENLILIYGFAKGRHDFGSLKNDCITFLYETLHKFDASKGTKAFSYFNVVGKNWLILNTRKRKKVQDNSYPIHDLESFSAADRHMISNHMLAMAPDDIMISAEQRDEIQEILKILRTKVVNTNDVACVEAVTVVFNKIDELDLLNKRAVYVYIREISGLNSKQLSTSMSTVRRLYKQIKGEELF
ncbi:MAG: hypothetical protein H8E12_11815, partial [Rhodobacteraceae bacterium]|nr:hypothetical protein [Paracoccaceae bacterium]